jgi:hypothetical protein
MQRSGNGGEWQKVTGGSSNMVAVEMVPPNIVDGLPQGAKSW